MKRSPHITTFLKFLPIILVPCLPWRVQSASPKPLVASQISSVTVYTDRAFVERKQTIGVKSGPTTITFERLSPLADPDSIKVHLSQGQVSDILGIRAEKQFLLKSENSELNKLQDEKRQLHEQKKAIENEVQSLVQINSHLQNLSQHYRDSFSLKLHQNQWSKPSFVGFIEFLAQKSSDLQSTWKKLYLRYDEIVQKLEAVSGKIASMSNAGDREYLNVYIDVLSYGSAEQTVHLSYLVPDARWVAAYDLRIDSKKAEAQLEQYALVQQNTGEDWREVNLQLSNVRSELRPQAPVINSYTIHGREVKRVITSVGSVKDNAASLTTSGSGGASQEANELEKTFEIFGKQTVLQSLNTTKVFVARATMPYKEYLELVAAQYPFVYRKAEFNNPFSWTLAGGALNLFYDRQFVSQNWLDDVAKGNQFSINAGLDHNVVVQHEHHDEQENSGLIDQRRQYRRKYVTTVTNYASQSKRVRLRSQMPVSQIKEVSVALEKETTPGFVKDSKNESWIYWEATLPTRKAVTHTTVISVATPKDFNFTW